MKSECSFAAAKKSDYTYKVSVIREGSCRYGAICSPPLPPSSIHRSPASAPVLVSYEGFIGQGADCLECYTECILGGVSIKVLEVPTVFSESSPADVNAFCSIRHPSAQGTTI